MGKSLIYSATTPELITDELARLKENLSITADNFVDVLEIFADNARSISIEKTRIVKVWSLTKPYLAANKLVIIYDAHLLTVEAQNSLLKILEEPNESLNIVLTTYKYDLLLPTVISRCEIREFSGNQPGKSNRQQLEEQAANGATADSGVITELKAIQKIFSVKVKTNDDKRAQLAAIKDFLVSQTLAYRQDLLHGKNQKKTLQNLRLLGETKKMLDANVLSRLALENLAVNLER